MAGAFPLARHVALDHAVRAYHPLALAAERALRAEYSPAAMDTLRRGGALRAARRAAWTTAGLMDAVEWDGCTGDTGDVGEGGGA